MCIPASEAYSYSFTGRSPVQEDMTQMTKAFAMFFVLFLVLLPFVHAVPNQASPATVPEATPDCSGTFTAPSESEIAKAIAGCQGISADGGVRNDIIGGKCKPVTLIFARGTSELGNIGQIVGPPFVVALEKEFGRGNVAVQGVNDYPAISADYCTGGG